MEYIANRVHELYRQDRMNSARIMLICLAEHYHVFLEPQTICAAYSPHLPDYYESICGLVQGGLMFMEIYYRTLGKSSTEISNACTLYVRKFHDYFGSIKCADLTDLREFPFKDCPPMCECLLCEALGYTCQVIDQILANNHING